MRTISEHFFQDLHETGGRLHPILKKLHRDQTLQLAIREDSINIYYRGGNILKISELRSGMYQTWFDPKYDRHGRGLPNAPAVIQNAGDAGVWAATFAQRKDLMDEFFSTHRNAEREFQQLVVRENNASPVANSSEYFITDIEAADSGLGCRFDMLAVCWPANRRQNESGCWPAFIEMKYGDQALSNETGILKHLQDFEAFIADRSRYQNACAVMQSQFEQLYALDMLHVNRIKGHKAIQFDPACKPQVIFILAAHNPRSRILGRILYSPELEKYAASPLFDLRFFDACFAGYALHQQCMDDLQTFREKLVS
ncbi:MAG: hypothetical protein PWQ55_529 [Chloroflexota bacterium]|nr:hypothetical protein [Chloroflexota bacterium]